MRNSYRQGLSKKGGNRPYSSITILALVRIKEACFSESREETGKKKFEKNEFCEVKFDLRIYVGK